MVIDYRPLLSKDPQDQANNMVVAYGRDSYMPDTWGYAVPADIEYLHQGNSKLEVCVIYDTIEYETTEKAPGLKGLFGKKVQEKHYRRGAGKVGVVAESVNCGSGVCVLEGPNSANNGATAKIVLDGKTGMAKLRRQPTSIGDVLDLLAVDPRYISQIDVSLIAPSARETVAIHVSRGLEKVLKNQAKLGVPYDENEHAQRESFKKEVVEAYATFEARWQAQNGNMNLTEEECQS